MSLLMLEQPVKWSANSKTKLYFNLLSAQFRDKPLLHIFLWSVTVLFVCLFALILYVPVNNFSVMKGNF